MVNDEPKFYPGLEGVIADESSICQVRADVDKLIYRGYDVSKLATERIFEETAHLLLFGRLPNLSELDQFKQQIHDASELPEAVVAMIRGLPAEMHPMDVLRTAVSASAGWDADLNNNTVEANQRKAVRLLAMMPIMLGVHQARVDGREMVWPEIGRGFAANLLATLNGKEPDADATRLMNCSLTLYAEHGFNASTFTGRVIASTLSDMYSAVSGAIGALKGALHGGANEAALKMLLEIGAVENTEPWVMDALSNKKKIMGFGHRVYKKEDSRATTLRKVGREVAEAKGETKLADLADKVHEIMKREKNLFPNADFPCAWVYYMLGIPTDMFTPIFACSRVTGWAAHVIEQLEGNRLIRPKCKYTGPIECDYTAPE